jgi:hypothetical protein
MMKNGIFINFGILYMIFTMVSDSLLLAPILLVAIYVIMMIIAALSLLKYKNVKAIILTVSSVFIVAYTIIGWNASGDTFYQPTAIHFLTGVILVVFGIVNIVKGDL